MNAPIYGCFNQPRRAAGGTYVAQAGWSPIFRDGAGVPQRVPIYVDVENRFDLSICDYTKTTPDPFCNGCMHQKAKP